MPTATLSTARQTLPELVNRAAYGGERIAISRRGRVLAAIVSAEDLALIERLEDAADTKAAQAALRDYARHGGTAWADVKRKAREARK